MTEPILRYYLYIKKSIRGPFYPKDAALQPGFGRSTLVCPEKALVLGPCRVISLEYPEIACRSVDLHALHAFRRQSGRRRRCRCSREGHEVDLMELLLPVTPVGAVHLVRNEVVARLAGLHGEALLVKARYPGLVETVGTVTNVPWA